MEETRGIKRQMEDAPTESKRLKPEDRVGSMGQTIKVVSNYVRIRFSSLPKLYQYQLDFQPETFHQGLRAALLRNVEPKLGVFLMSGEALWVESKIEKELAVVTSDKGEEFKITFQFAREIDPTRTSDPSMIQIFNIVVKKLIQGLKLTRMGRGYYDTRKIERWDRYAVSIIPGFDTSIIHATIGPLIQTLMTFKLLREDSVLDVMKSRSFDPSELKGATVVTKYNRFRTYRITGIDNASNPLSTFDYKGKPITYEEYLKKYSSGNRRMISDPNQPLLIATVKKRGGVEEEIRLVPEVCHMTGISEQMRSAGNFTMDMTKKIGRTPKERADDMTRFVNDLTRTDDPRVQEIIKSWGFELQDHLLEIDARCMGALPVVWHGDQKNNTDSRQYGDWSGFFKDRLKFIEPKSVNTWCIIHDARNDRDANNLSNLLQSTGSQFGMRMSQPRMFSIRDDRDSEWLRQIETAQNANADLIVCVLPSNSATRYSAIKKSVYNSGHVVQCVVAKNLGDKKARSVVTKIVQQVNSKLGGGLWKVQPINVNKPTMMCGIETSSSKKAGVTAITFTSSYDMNFTKYCAFTKKAQSVQECLYEMFQSAVKQFVNTFNVPPVEIIIYRSGVGRGQLNIVRDQELSILQSVASEFNGRLCYIVVSRKINAKFFAYDHGGQLTNPPPGTIIDTSVVHEPLEDFTRRDGRPSFNPMKYNEYEFYLIAQKVTQGTVGPTHYHVLCNQTDYPTTGIQWFTYMLCHVYYNWPGTIAIPAPCQYAMKAAFQVSNFTKEEPHPRLAPLPHYL